MRARLTNLLTAVALSVAASLPMVTASYAEGGNITVEANMARILRINSPAATVIIGNPAVADVTIQDATTLVLTGKSFGETNLIILDGAGDPIADTIVEVVKPKDDILTVYMGAARQSMSCNPDCQPSIMIGDDTGYTAQAISSSAMVEDAAE